MVTTGLVATDPSNDVAVGGTATAALGAGPAALAEGAVVHQRPAPAEHEFVARVSYAWFDPDRPDELCDPHPLWSARRPAPARFRRTDYGLDHTLSLGDEVRRDLRPLVGEVDGPIRVLTQIRRWGWLFNPISLFFAWNDDGTDAPVGAVLEVTNTPWHERHRYPVALDRSGDRLTASFDKELHVSPFLGMDYRYELSVADRPDRVAVDIDVVDPAGDLALHTALRLGRVPASRAVLGRSIRAAGLPTHRVTAGIHVNAARLARKRVPFVPHPSKRPSPPEEPAS